MEIKIGALTKGLLTSFTLIWFLPSVGSPMFYKIRALAEMFITLATHIRLLSSVDSLMFDHV